MDVDAALALVAVAIAVRVAAGAEEALLEWIRRPSPNRRARLPLSPVVEAEGALAGSPRPVLRVHSLLEAGAEISDAVHLKAVGGGRGGGPVQVFAPP